MKVLAPLRMGNDLTLWMRHELQVGEDDRKFANNLNNLIAGKTEFWHMVFYKFGIPMPTENR